MIRKSGYRFSLGTNAKRLPGDHAQTKRLERDDDSKKSHPALVLRTLPALLSAVQIFSHSSAETASAQCPSRSGVIAASRKIIGFSEQSKLIVNFFRKRCAWGLT